MAQTQDGIPSSLRKKGILTCAPTWMLPEDVMLRERSPHGKMLWLLLGGPWRSQIHRHRKWTVGARGAGGSANSYGVSLGLATCSGLRGDVTQPCECPKYHEVVHLQMVILGVNVTSIKKP